MQRLIFYSHDTYGLGNVRRMLAIAEFMVSTHKQISILVISGSPMMHAYRLSERIDYIKLPCLSRTYTDGYSPRYLNVSHDRLLKLRSDIILNALLDFEADLVLVDKKPLGVQNELAPALQVLKRRENRPKLVLLLREILDEPAKTRRIWEKNLYHQVISELYDQVLVLGSSDRFDTAVEYGFPSSTTRKLNYCGYLSKQCRLTPTDQVRQSQSWTDKKVILVTPGGGEDGSLIVNSMCSVAGQLDDTFLIVICTGPEMPVKTRQQIEAQLGSSNRIRLLEFSDDMISLMSAADVVVSMAGYNTVTELIQLKTPAVLIPRITPVKEQWLRAQSFNDLEQFRVLSPATVTERTLLTAISQLLASRSSINGPLPAIDLNALPAINRHIENLFSNDYTGGWEQPSFDTGIPFRSTPSAIPTQCTIGLSDADGCSK